MKKIRKFIGDISLRDKCVMLFMIILIIDSAYSLFTPIGGKHSAAIDIVVRTTMASIFGYLLGSNFMIKKPTTKKQRSKKQAKIECICKELEEENENEDEPIKEETNNIQVIIATVIGISSLLVLIIARDLVQLPDDALATISQFRSFVSGSIGFLIGIPKDK
ncbi:hypothetical protein [Niameybacter massiliensis]|uniref:hypothetical protein n=1 Tax=Niameybacter massiliensis TaxID=1658108 RepID=UPI0006B4656B|nr:hypothetical protein [Niameybacter massiliensis]